MSETQAFYAALPKKRMGAGALFLNAQGNVLLVNPTYKPQWEIPGGIVELNESPRQTCIREIQEELALIRNFERLLCVSYIPASSERTEGVMYIFWGGILTENEIAQIRLPLAELSEFAFVKPDEIKQHLTARLSERVLRCLAIIPTEQTLYLE